MVHYSAALDNCGADGYCHSHTRPTHAPTATPHPTSTPVPVAAAGTWRGITVSAENRCSEYDSGDYAYSPSVEPKIVTDLGGIYGPYTGSWFDTIRETDIEHIVARSEAHAAQVMRYMMFLQLQNTLTQGRAVTGEVYYGEDNTGPIAAAAADEEFREMVEGLIGRLTAKAPPRKIPTASECRFCPIPKDYCPERIEG